MKTKGRRYTDGMFTFFIGGPILLALALASSEPTASPRLTAPPQGLILYATGQDQTAQLQALYDQAMDGDTITLRPLNGVKRFFHTAPLNWTGTKAVNVDATGSEFYAGMALTGTQASITWGAATGANVNAEWRGGTVIGCLAVQNVSYSKHIDPAGAATLIIQADTSCSYNDIHTGSVTGGCGNGSGLIYNQLNNNAWMNCNHFYGVSMSGRPVGGQSSPVIWQVNQAATWQPSYSIFAGCCFEGDNQVLLNVGKSFSATFENCYAEGTFTEGTGGGIESLTWHDMPAKLAGWLSDPRNIHSGVLQ